MRQAPPSALLSARQIAGVAGVPLEGKNSRSFKGQLHCYGGLSGCLSDDKASLPSYGDTKTCFGAVTFDVVQSCCHRIRHRFHHIKRGLERLGSFLRNACSVCSRATTACSKDNSTTFK